MAPIQEKIKEIEEEIRRTPYNKATQQHIGKLKAKLAKLREEGEKQSGGASGSSYAVKKSGDATVVLVGFPSVGKSTLLNQLTNATSPVGTYDFTTLDVIPGLMEHREAKIQVLDVPGLIEGAASGKGRGKEVISVVRNADLILIILDVFELGHLEIIERELHGAGVRINKKPHDVRVKKTSKGGVKVNSTVPLTKLDDALVKAILSEYRIHSADVLLREDIDIDDLIDVVAKNRVYSKGLTIINKTDLMSKKQLRSVKKNHPDAVFISAHKGIGIDVLKERIFDTLGFIHVYMKPQGEEADLEEPLIIKDGARVREVCDVLHRDFKRRFRFARIWGNSVRFVGQRVGLDHRVCNGDIISIVLDK